MGKESVMEPSTTAVSGAAITSPLWLHTVHTGHLVLDAAYNVAQYLLPFAGLAWIAMQMHYKRKNENK